MMIGRLFGWFLGAIDQVVRLVNVLADVRPKFFPLGFGDPQNALDEAKKIYSALRSSNSKVPDLFQVENKLKFDSATVSGNVSIKIGHFPSPLHHVLPDESKNCRFYHVQPLDESKRQPVTLILLPATGEEGKSERLNMARHMASRYGWSSAIITAPFYAARKPKGQRMFFIRSAEEIMHQGSAIMTEAAALGCYFMARHSDHKVCFSGFSYGAAMSMGAAMMCLSSQPDGRRIACVPYVGCGSPCIVADGVIESMVDWKALRKASEEPYEVTRERLYNILAVLNFDELLDILQEQGDKSIGSLHLLNMTHDHFIPGRHSRVFTEQALKVTNSETDTKVRSIPGGHAIAALIRPRYQTQAVVAAIQGLK